MKTNLFILLALGTSASLTHAAGLSIPSVKVSPAVPKNLGVHSLPATSRIPLKPAISGSSLPKGVPHVLPPKHFPASSSSAFRPNGIASLKSSSAAKLPSLNNINRAATTDPRVAGFGGAKGAGMNAGFDAVNALKDMNGIRNTIPDSMKQFGINGNTPAKPGFDVPNFGDEDSFNGGTGNKGVSNPLDRFANAKPRDINDSFNKSRQGTRAGDRPMSSFGRELSRQGSRDGRIIYGSNGNDRTSYSSRGPGLHNTTEHRDPGGRTTGYTDDYMNLAENRTTTDHYDANGTFKGSETITIRGDGSSQCKDVAADGSVVVTEKDSTGHVTTTQGCDRNPSEGASLGGASGPSVRDAIGLKPIDLLRQQAEGQQTTRTLNPRTREQFGNANQVRPDSSENARTPARRNQTTVGQIISINPEVGGGDDPTK